MEPLRHFKELYSFLDLPWTEKVEKFVQENTRAFRGIKISDTFRSMPKIALKFGS